MPTVIILLEFRAYFKNKKTNKSYHITPNNQLFRKYPDLLSEFREKMLEPSYKERLSRSINLYTTEKENDVWNYYDIEIVEMEHSHDFSFRVKMNLTENDNKCPYLERQDLIFMDNPRMLFEGAMMKKFKDNLYLKLKHFYSYEHFITLPVPDGKGSTIQDSCCSYSKIAKVYD